jgi:D-sedoheptulose 7-phosphate isomerase
MNIMSDEPHFNNYFATVARTLDNINRDDIYALVDILLRARQEGKHIFVFGNGGSAATASHICGDLLKGVSFGLQQRFKPICLNGVDVYRQ